MWCCAVFFLRRLSRSDKIPSDGFRLLPNRGENVAVRYYLEEYDPSPFMQVVKEHVARNVALYVDFRYEPTDEKRGGSAAIR